MKVELFFNVLSKSLRGFVTHVQIEARPPLKDDTNAMVRMQEIYRPLLDKIMKKSDDSGKKIAYLLLDWLLLEYPYRDLMSHSLKEFAMAVFRDVEALTQWGAQLSNVILHDGILSTQAQQEIKIATSKPITPTLVVQLDSDNNTRGIGDNVHMKTVGWGFSVCMVDMYQVIKEIQTWNSKGGRLLPAGLGDTSEMISRFNRHQGNKSTGASWHDILSSFTRVWDIISVALSQTTASLSPSALLDQATEYAKNEAIPPYFRLIVAGIYLGYYEHAMPINDVLQRDGLGLTLLAHSTFIVSERVKHVGIMNARSVTLARLSLAFTDQRCFHQVSERVPVGNKVAAVVRDVTLPLLTDIEIAQVWSLITKKLFEEPVELDFAALGVIAQYTLARPQILVPDLMGRLSLPDPRNPSKQDEVTTNPDLVIGFLYDRDLNSRMTASHIVASLDPVRTIQTFGPDLASPDIDVRSSGALILIECMLSQKQDGSIGEGLGCFINYIRPTSQGTAAKTVSEEALFKVLKKMGDATPPPVWPSVVQVVLSKMYSSPSDPVLMRIWNTLVPALSTSVGAIAATYLGVTEIMERQGEVSESLLEAAMEASDEGLDDLRMSRILPFTVLKTFSAALYAQTFITLEQQGEDMSIRVLLKSLLTSRTENDLEFTRVRELAANTLEDLFSD
ncbi:hypothetical protein BG005_003627 [Podila minutissima]|nr:hypothetical protein BG005_003627 [Podila minutissima]